MKDLIRCKPLRLVCVLFGYVWWRMFLTDVIGGEEAMSILISQALYCRLMYFRDSQVFGSVIGEIVRH